MPSAYSQPSTGPLKTSRVKSQLLPISSRPCTSWVLPPFLPPHFIYLLPSVSRLHQPLCPPQGLSTCHSLCSQLSLWLAAASYHFCCVLVHYVSTLGSKRRRTETVAVLLSTASVPVSLSELDEYLWNKIYKGIVNRWTRSQGSGDADKASTRNQ